MRKASTIPHLCSFSKQCLRVKPHRVSKAPPEGCTQAPKHSEETSRLCFCCDPWGPIPELLAAAHALKIEVCKCPRYQHTLLPPSLSPEHEEGADCLIFLSQRLPGFNTVAGTLARSVTPLGTLSACIPRLYMVQSHSSKPAFLLGQHPAVPPCPALPTSPCLCCLCHAPCS